MRHLGRNWGDFVADCHDDTGMEYYVEAYRMNQKQNCSWQRKDRSNGRRSTDAHSRTRL